MPVVLPAQVGTPDDTLLTPNTAGSKPNLFLLLVYAWDGGQGDGKQPPAPIACLSAPELLRTPPGKTEGKSEPPGICCMSHWTLFTKHTFKDKTNKNFKEGTTKH